MSRWAIPPTDYHWRQQRAGVKRGEQLSVDAFFRRIAIKDLLRQIEEKKGRRVKPHSLATIDALVKGLREIALKYDSECWVRKALTVKRSTLVNDLKMIQKEKKATGGTKPSNLRAKNYSESQ
jgi:hypothetical protein